MGSYAILVIEVFELSWKLEFSLFALAIIAVFTKSAQEPLYVVVNKLFVA